MTVPPAEYPLRRQLHIHHYQLLSPHRKSSKIITFNTIPTRTSTAPYPMKLCVWGGLFSAPHPLNLRVRGGKYFSDELLHLFSVMATIHPICPIEWDKVMEIHNNKIPGRESESLRHKYTSTHRRKVPTEDPECPLEVRETTLVKLAIGNKAELANYDKEYDMEVDSYEPEESDGVVTRVGTFPAQTHTCRCHCTAGDCTFGRTNPINYIWWVYWWCKWCMMRLRGKEIESWGQWKE